MVVAPNEFRDEEYLEPYEVFIENHIKVDTASKGVTIATGKMGEEVDVDIDIRKVNIKEYNAFVFVGGVGAYEFIEDEDVLELVRKIHADESKVIGAICIAPMILHAAGVLEGKSVTVWDGDSKQSKVLEDSGIDYSDDSVVEDMNLITANGPEAATEFGEAIVNRLDEI